MSVEGYPEPPELLEAAADRIERCGWWQGALYGPLTDEPPLPMTESLDAYVAAREVPCCAVGAIRVSLVGRKGWPPLARTADVLERYLAIHYPGYVSIPQWNDAPGRTAEEVVAALREAARMERAGELP